MKYQQLHALEKELAQAGSAHIHPLYLIVSKEDFPRKQAVESILNILLKNQERSLSLKVFEGESVSVEQLFQELSNVSFLSNSTVVSIQHAEKLKKNLTEALLNYLQRPNKSVSIVLSAESWSAASTFYKKIEEKGILLQIAPEKAWEKEKIVREWLSEKAALSKKPFAPGAAEALLKQMGADQLLLETELDKLICYVGDRDKIVLQDIVAISGCGSSETIWQLAEAILQKNASVALRIGRSLLSEGSNIFALIQQIRRQLETGFQICSLLGTESGRDEIMKLFPYMKGNILEKNIAQAQGYGVSRFKKGLIALHEIEVRAKNSGGEHDLLMELLLARLAS